MNKKLIAVALAALPLAAMADVTLYGTMKGSVEHDTATGQASKSQVQDDTSLIGFKGSEDLGNGLKSVWQVETRLKLGDSSSGAWGTRQTFVGLDGGNLGLVRIGYVNNFLNDQYSVDQWSYSSTATRGSLSGANGLGVFTNSGDRIKNAIRYDSATFGGFSAGIEYGFGENKTTTASSTTTTTSSDVLGLGLNYTYGDVAAHYAMQREKNPSNSAANDANSNQAATKHLFEVDYNANNLFVSAAYQISTGYDWSDDFSGDGTALISGTTNAAAKVKARQAALSVGYTIGAFTPKATYAKGWNMKADGNTVNDSGYRQYVFGVDYALSKRTTVGLAYGNLQYGAGTSEGNGSKVTLKTLAFNMAHSF
jgi:predicted porin